MAACEIDVVCDCGQNALMAMHTGVRSMRHPVDLFDAEVYPKPYLLECGCGKRYAIVIQSNHFHVNSY